MRFSQLFIQTHRESTGDIEFPGNQFLQRAGYIRQLEKGIFTLFPLANRSLQKMMNLARQELSFLSAQEINIPSFTPSTREDLPNLLSPFDYPPLTVRDTANRNWEVSPSSPQYLADIIQHTVRSHRQLPRLLYQFQSKILPGKNHQDTLLSARNITRLEWFQLANTDEQAESGFENLNKAIQNILTKCRLPVQKINYKNLLNDDQTIQEMYFLHSKGDNSILSCPACNYLNNQKNTPTNASPSNHEEMLSLEEVHTPGMKTIEELSSFLNIPASKTAKAVFITAIVFENGELQNKVIIAIVRGDKDLDENKLATVIQSRRLRPATEEEILSLGATPGFASPIGLKKGLIVVDNLIKESKNLVAGANKTDFHYKNVNFSRDFDATFIADLSQVKSGDACPHCGKPLEMMKGFLISSSSSPTPQFSTKANCNFQDESGVARPVLVGYSWLDLENVFGGIAETFNDPFGLRLPFHLTPFQVHLI
ncbi:MAG TPA: YbaK/EbsC family protein, partial [Anaerolineaceae bacterium]|nr:YbaK/EbsC family protein [Anaerolineaceae bacterium]